MNPDFETSCSMGLSDEAQTKESTNGAKPRIAVFSLTSCEGCSLAILELEDQLIDILDVVEIVNFREAMSERSWEIDIGFVDGAVSTPDDEAEIRHFRDHCGTLVAIGACACVGGINTLKNHQDETAYRRYVYGDRAKWFPTQQAKPLSAFVKVDYELPGCPMVKEEFLELVKCLLIGKPFRLPDFPVCVECKKLGNPCLYEQGIVCLGPVTRAGCRAICPSYGSKCEACRGVLSAEALRAAGVNLQERYGVTLDEIRSDLRLYGAHQEEKIS
ncbi:MAG TPA: NADH:ubiquinone oxidoreductase [Phycisphaerae bacterium]|nr:NADH:ubiquinone oxidoreductase [Phycisphaerae bacterium]HRW52333.1 NADH:ubiquinone oxidoreductase [Phycisphaerae bacterium]